MLLVGLLLAAAAVYWGTRTAPQQQTIADADDPAVVARGAELYAGNCASCHGANLEGQPNWRSPLPDGTRPAPPHDAHGHTFHHPDALLFTITKLGGQAVAPPGFRSNMPPFADQMSDADIWATLAFIKNSWPPEIRATQQKINRAAAAQ